MSTHTYSSYREKLDSETGLNPVVQAQLEKCLLFARQKVYDRVLRAAVQFDHVT